MYYAFEVSDPGNIFAMLITLTVFDIHVYNTSASVYYIGPLIYLFIQNLLFVITVIMGV